MDKEVILELARKRARAARSVECLGYLTVGRTPDEEIARSARYTLACDALAKAESDYDAAIRNLSADELYELAQSDGERTSENPEKTGA